MQRTHCSDKFHLIDNLHKTKYLLQFPTNLVRGLEEDHFATAERVLLNIDNKFSCTCVTHFSGATCLVHS